jgi:hypothetical protein
MDALTTLTQFISSDPLLRAIQGGLLLLGALDLFLLFWTLRDVLVRTRSFVYQSFCILLVAGLPFVGFLCYLLIRPARTVKDREIEKMLKAVLAENVKNVTTQKKNKEAKEHKSKKEKKTPSHV